ncbi:ribosome modulation factor [Methylobacterium sp. Leaf118]|uniref:ribosome modulation factor n=1 Tax=Methylobacterium sp. Leaf118 TaxID=2876562 RepID=UPI003FA5C9AA
MHAAWPRPEGPHQEWLPRGAAPYRAHERHRSPHRHRSDCRRARARTQGRPRDACPYPGGSSERREWLEGYDGAPMDRAPDLPMDNG